MDEHQLKSIIEALLLSSTEPLSIEKLMAVFDDWERPTKTQVHEVIHLLQDELASRSFELIEVASGFILQTRKEFSSWIARLQIEKPSKYSRALLETLAIIAYKQPVTRGDIEELRGVTVNSQIIKTLLEREWIRIAGYRDVPGRPAVYITTKEFLNYFNLKNLNDLPSLPEILESLILNNPKEECTTE